MHVPLLLGSILLPSPSLSSSLTLLPSLSAPLPILLPLSLLPSLSSSLALLPSLSAPLPILLPRPSALSLCSPPYPPPLPSCPLSLLPSLSSSLALLPSLSAPPALCSPACNNGGTCVLPGHCHCTPEWAGSTCNNRKCRELVRGWRDAWGTASLIVDYTAAMMSPILCHLPCSCVHPHL